MRGYVDGREECFFHVVAVAALGSDPSARKIMRSFWESLDKLLRVVDNYAKIKANSRAISTKADCLTKDKGKELGL